MESYPEKYLTKSQALEKYSFLSANMLKNLLFKDVRGFRSKVVRKIGRRIVLDEVAFLQFIAEGKDGVQ